MDEYIDPNETFTFPGVTTGKKATASALLVQTSEGKQLWVPQSQIHDDSDVWKEGQSGRLIVTAWWAMQKGLV